MDIPTEELEKMVDVVVDAIAAGAPPSEVVIRVNSASGSLELRPFDLVGFFRSL